MMPKTIQEKLKAAQDLRAILPEGSTVSTSERAYHGKKEVSLYAVQQGRIRPISYLVSVALGLQLLSSGVSSSVVCEGEEVVVRDLSRTLYPDAGPSGLRQESV